MERKLRSLAIGVAATVALTLGTGVLPAAAATSYPGAAYCSTNNASTLSTTAGFDHSVGHRAEGYAGYYYATFSVVWYSSVKTKIKNWGFKDILSSRITTTQDATIQRASVGCGL